MFDGVRFQYSKIFVGFHFSECSDFIISKFFSHFNHPSVTVPRAPITIGITVTFMFHSFFFFNSLGRFRYLSFFSFSFNFILWSAGTEKSTILQVLFFFIIIDYYYVWSSGRLTEISWFVCILKSQRSLCVSRTDSGLCISSSSSSSCRAASMDIPDPLSPLLPITHRLWQVLRTTSRILTELLYVGSSWSSCICSAIWVHHLWAHPCFSSSVLHVWFV